MENLIFQLSHQHTTNLRLRPSGAREIADHTVSKLKGDLSSQQGRACSISPYLRPPSVGKNSHTAACRANAAYASDDLGITPLLQESIMESLHFYCDVIRKLFFSCHPLLRRYLQRLTARHVLHARSPSPWPSPLVASFPGKATSLFLLQEAMQSHTHFEDIAKVRRQRRAATTPSEESREKERSVSAISSRMADIPSDLYSWRKACGQKPIKGSPTRGYYKCSSLRGCPARKHVGQPR
ncbi:hypothetical protein HPP92_016793 [Vanilla planifolia]|uniref:WRKY domain-containing protein n=1 Tax=Vanilla planifolia TaxID=51239 RepID=A0A835QNW8_VANPL|nr:hypothetical protein HPP92_016793 [Vanilla planifolia]